MPCPITSIDHTDEKADYMLITDNIEQSEVILLLDRIQGHNSSWLFTGGEGLDFRARITSFWVSKGAI